MDERPSYDPATLNKMSEVIASVVREKLNARPRSTCDRCGKVEETDAQTPSRRTCAACHENSALMRRLCGQPALIGSGICRNPAVESGPFGSWCSEHWAAQQVAIGADPMPREYSTLTTGICVARMAKDSDEHLRAWRLEREAHEATRKALAAAQERADNLDLTLKVARNAVLNAADKERLANGGKGGRLIFSCGRDAYDTTTDTRVVTFSPDGTVDVNPRYTTAEAAAKFWECVLEINPAQKTIAALESANERLREHVAELAVKRVLDPAAKVLPEALSAAVAKDIYDPDGGYLKNALASRSGFPSCLYCGHRYTSNEEKLKHNAACVPMGRVARARRWVNERWVLLLPPVVCVIAAASAASIPRLYDLFLAFR